MKNFKLFLAFTALSTVAMATEVPVAVETSATETTMASKAMNYATAPFTYVNDTFKAADKTVVDFVKSTKNTVVDIVTPYVKTTSSVSSDVISELVASPVRLVAVAGACYAAYFAYNAHNDAANKKSKN